MGVPIYLKPFACLDWPGSGSRDEESDPRKCIGEEVTGHTKGWTFLLPDDGSPSDPTTIVGAYLAYLAVDGKDLV